jgi:single-strand DNA-binding protein
MSDGMNRVTLYGHLGQDPELRITKENVGVLSLRLATTESWVDKETKLPQTRTEWHDCVLFGPRADALSRFVRKGDGLLVEGSLRTSSYEKDGVKRRHTEVVVRDLYLGPKGRRPSTSTLDMSPPQPQVRADLSQAVDLPF